jgi:hypothetical protein
MRNGFVVLLIAFAIGCTYFTSWDNVMQRWVGLPISDYVEVEGKPDQKWLREDGHTIYMYEFEGLDPSCVHYWVVDEGGVIVNFYYEGYCHPIG